MKPPTGEKKKMVDFKLTVASDSDCEIATPRDDPTWDKEINNGA